MELTKESKKIFFQTLKKVIKDLDEIRSAEKDHYVIKIEMKNAPALYRGRNWYLLVSNEKFVIYYHAYSIYEANKDIVFARINKFGKATLPENINFDPYSLECLIAFMEEIPDIRAKLAKAVEDNIKNKQEQAIKKKIDQEETLQRLKEIQNRCNGLATIEIEMPETNNQHEIELKEEHGQKIGTIKINGLTLRIITSGDVKITNDLEKGKAKRR